MKLQDFSVEPADWSNAAARESLQGIRDQVFVQEQRVPQSRERDGLDSACWHVLALDPAGQPIGCGRLEASGKIGRMAVVREWRGSGVGGALLSELVARARTQGLAQARLAAQVTAQGFYERAGFTASGEVFEDGGLPHRSMTLPLVAAPATAPSHAVVESLRAGSLVETAAARWQLLADARHQVSIRVPLLLNDCYASLDELTELRRIALSGRAAQIRILLHDAAAALRNDHRLVALAQRLPSAIQIRQPVEDVDLAVASSCLLNDVGGYLFQADAERPHGRAARRDAASLAPLKQQFDEAWDRSERASVLQRLDL